jgi:hypothetical protein
MAQYRKDTNQYLDNGKTIFEVVMLADQYGNQIGPANPSGTAVDAFGRARVSEPYTLFDHMHRFDDNEWQFANTISATANSEFKSEQGLLHLNVDTTNGAFNKKESRKVFSYQPGKSLQIMQTFQMDEPKDGLRQRIGYFGANNGIYLEQSNSDIYFVNRYLTDSGVEERRIPQAQWNYDTMDGDGPSHITLDLTKSQIWWTDVEWLGVGSVRTGFVVDGQFIHCHSFHHANRQANTYMQTACLPLRVEIENTAATASNSTLKMICSTVISEGGYQLRGEKRSVSIPINSPKNLANANVYYAAAGLKLKTSDLDAIVIPRNISLMGIGNNAYFNWRLIRGGAIQGGSWVDAGTTSSVMYNITGSTIASGGRVVASGFISSTNQSGSGTVNLTGEDVFGLQLRADRFHDQPEEFILAVAPKVAGDDVYAAIDWEEITR